VLVAELAAIGWCVYVDEAGIKGQAEGRQSKKRSLLKRLPFPDAGWRSAVAEKEQT
jgi:hypothetical protein